MFRTEAKFLVRRVKILDTPRLSSLSLPISTLVFSPFPLETFANSYLSPETFSDGNERHSILDGDSRLSPRRHFESKKKKRKKDDEFRSEDARVRNTLDKWQRLSNICYSKVLYRARKQLTAKRHRVAREDPSEKIFCPICVLPNLCPNRPWFERMTMRACKRRTRKKEGREEKKVGNLRSLSVYIRCPYVYAENCAKSRCFISIIWESTGLGCCRQRYGCFYFYVYHVHSEHSPCVFVLTVR